jgi:hypothetical protein
MTNSDGTISTFTDDLPGDDALGAAVAGVWASAITGIQSKAPMETATRTRLIVQLLSDKSLHPRRAEHTHRVARPVIAGVRRHTEGTLLSRNVRAACRGVWIGLGASNEKCAHEESEQPKTFSGHLSGLLSGAGAGQGQFDAAVLGAPLWRLIRGDRVGIP